MDCRVLLTAAAVFLAQPSITRGADDVSDAQWGATRCNVVSPQDREPCMAAHIRLGIASDEIVPEKGSVVAGASSGAGNCDAVRTFAETADTKLLPPALRGASFAPDLRAAVKEYAIALKASPKGAQLERAKASLDIELVSACSESSGAGSTDAPEISRGKELVANRMKDPSSVQFKDVVYFKARQVVCGSVNAKNSYGAYGGFEQFAVGPDGVVHMFDGSTSCYGSEKYACLKRKIVEMQAIKENCSSTPELKLPDDPKGVRARVEALGDLDGAMSWALQEEAVAWIERNQASTDREVVRAMVDLCELLGNRGSKGLSIRLTAIENGAADRKVRHECGAAREEFED